MTDTPAAVARGIRGLIVVVVMAAGLIEASTAAADLLISTPAESAYV